MDRDENGEAEAGKPASKERPNQVARYSSGEDLVSASEFDYILDLLKVRSDWQEYILPNLKTAKSSPRSLQVLSVSDYQDKTKMGTNIPGITYKQTGDIITQQWNMGTDRKTFLSAALHECVHLISHPPEQKAKFSTAYTKLGEGLSEGLVELVTKDILATNQITLPGVRKLGHEQRVQVVKELVRQIRIPLLARVLFLGDDRQLSMVMEFTYSKPGWMAIKAGATSQEAKKVIALMNDLQKAETEKRRQRDLARKPS